MLSMRSRNAFPDKPTTSWTLGDQDAPNRKQRIEMVPLRESKQ
jgi:hypothetical protein